MIEVPGENDIWQYHQDGSWIVIPTNGTVKSSGELVMGRGLARQAQEHFPELPGALGHAVRLGGNHVYLIRPRVFSFPVKHQWWEKADIELITQSALELAQMAPKWSWQLPVVLPRVGCGNGGLYWEGVKAILEPILDDRFLVVHKGEK